MTRTVSISGDDDILTCRDLSVSYGCNAVIINLSGTIPRHGVTAIMGPSGCGKSTLLKVLNRTLELIPGGRIGEGEVCFDGEDIYDPSVDPLLIRRRIGMIHQRPVVFPMSIRENVLFGVRFHRLVPYREMEQESERWLCRVGLWDEVKDRLRDPGACLSGGQQQRLCLARTLATRPEVLLMDEPCSALDPAATRRIESLVRELAVDYPIVIVTHNMSQARRISDQAWFLYEGRLVEHGSTETLFANPATALTNDFVTGNIG